MLGVKFYQPTDRKNEHGEVAYGYKDLYMTIAVTDIARKINPPEEVAVTSRRCFYYFHDL